MRSNRISIHLVMLFLLCDANFLNCFWAVGEGGVVGWGVTENIPVLSLIASLAGEETNYLRFSLPEIYCL